MKQFLIQMTKSQFRKEFFTLTRQSGVYFLGDCVVVVIGTDLSTESGTESGTDSGTDLSTKERKERSKEKKENNLNPNINDESFKSIMNTIMDTWNSITGLQSFKIWNLTRKNKLRARLKENVFRERHLEAIKRLGQSKFAKGKNDRGWKASIDWFLENDNNYVKAYEGKYDGEKRLWVN